MYYYYYYYSVTGTTAEKVTLLLIINSLIAWHTSEYIMFGNKMRNLKSFHFFSSFLFFLFFFLWVLLYQVKGFTSKCIILKVGLLQARNFSP